MDDSILRTLAIDDEASIRTAIWINRINLGLKYGNSYNLYRELSIVFICQFNLYMFLDKIEYIKYKPIINTNHCFYYV